MISVPEAFAEATVRREGKAGQQWLTELPQLVDTLCDEWRLTLEGPLMHGYLGLVIPARRDQEACILKVSWIDDSTAEEAIALATWKGRGAVRLLESCPSMGAMLLERLDHRRCLEDVDITEAVPIAGRLLRRLAIPAPAGIRSSSLVAEEIYQTLPERWRRHGQPMSRRLLDRARDLALELGEPNEELLVNYDLHYVDVLAATREPWLAVDPKVVVGDPEFGVAQLLWTRLEDFETGGGLELHFHSLIEAAELDVELTRAWTLVRCLDYWLWGLSVGLTTDPARCEIIVDRLASRRPVRSWPTI